MAEKGAKKATSARRAGDVAKSTTGQETTKHPHLPPMWAQRPRTTPVDRGFHAMAAFGEMALTAPPPPLEQGQHHCLGIVAGSDSPHEPGVRPIGDLATDLCEIAPNGQVALAGDTFRGNRCLENLGWSPSLGLHVKPGTLGGKVEFDNTFGWQSLYAETWPHVQGGSQLPAGTVQVRVGDYTRDYALVTRTRTVNEDGMIKLDPIDSRLVYIDPNGPGWQSVPDSPRNADWQWYNQTQISGCQAPDGWVYIVADSFKRDKPVVLYHCRAETFEDRNTWWAWAQVPGDPLHWAWDQPKVPPTRLSDDNWGELSLRMIEGKFVLSGFNATTGRIEVRVADDVTQVLRPENDGGPPVTVVVDQIELPHNYGGYLVPGSTLDQAHILVSQWGGEGEDNYPYNVREYVVNLKR